MRRLRAALARAVSGLRFLKSSERAQLAHESFLLAINLVSEMDDLDRDERRVKLRQALEFLRELRDSEVTISDPGRLAASIESPEWAEQAHDGLSAGIAKDRDLAHLILSAVPASDIFFPRGGRR